MKALITGGCGFVGSNLAARLLADGAHVTVLDSMTRSGSEKNLAWLRTLGLSDFLPADIRNTATLEQAIRTTKPDALFHLAGQVAMTTSLADPRTDFEINALGTLNVLEAVRLHSPQTAILYASSNKTYGDLDWLELEELPTRYQPRGKQGIDEHAPIDLRTPYGCSKGTADQYVLDYARNFGLNTVVFRHSTIYGGHQYATRDQGWLGWFCRQALEVERTPNREPFTISGDGKQVRDLLHISDAINAYLAALERIEAAKGEAFNLGGGSENSSSLLELFASLETRLGIKLPYTKLPWRMSDQKYFVSDNTKANRILRWSPTVTKESGIDEMLAWERHLA
jgi:CDP-paratose 2-epimerase